MNSIRRHSVVAIDGQIIAQKATPWRPPRQQRLTKPCVSNAKSPDQQPRRVPDGTLGPSSTRPRTRCYMCRLVSTILPELYR